MTNQEAADLIRIAQAEIEWDYPMEYAIAFDKAIEALEAAGWVSVKDRLPTEKGDYLVAYHPCYWDNVVWGTVLVGIDNFRGKTTWAKRKYQRITHWMPLPSTEGLDDAT